MAKTTKRRAAPKVTEYTRYQLQFAAKKQCGDALDSLPSHNQLLWAACEQDGARKGQKQLYIGEVMQKDDRVPLFAYIAMDSSVRFCSSTRDLPGRNWRAKFELTSPFGWLPTGVQRSRNTALESLITYYFVISGQESIFRDGPEYSASLRGLEIACQLVKRGLGMFTFMLPGYDD